MNPFDKGCDTVRLGLLNACNDVRALLVSAQEETPAKALEGFTVDENQAETAANVELALRSIEDAAMRLNVAKHVYLGDSTLILPQASLSAAAVAPAATTAPEDDTEETDSSDDSTGESNGTEAADAGDGESSGD